MSEPSPVPSPNLFGGLQRLLGSSKALVVLLAIIGVVVMQVAGRVDAERALDFIKWLVMALIGATAAEDAAKKLGKPSDS